ncbi:hypothetical protein K502DRAFT_342106 [Neoconidiobolus thromboides FSU 785]|nr:hypothetical protein K502DRAFT_342106 [Neoconidiobolus thromboides FSU 785]
MIKYTSIILLVVASVLSTPVHTSFNKTEAENEKQTIDTKKQYIVLNFINSSKGSANSTLNQNNNNIDQNKSVSASKGEQSVLGISQISSNPNSTSTNSSSIVAEVNSSKPNGNNNPNSSSMNPTTQAIDINQSTSNIQQSNNASSNLNSTAIDNSTPNTMITQNQNSNPNTISTSTSESESESESDTKGKVYKFNTPFVNMEISFDPQNNRGMIMLEPISESSSTNNFVKEASSPNFSSIVDTSSTSSENDITNNSPISNSEGALFSQNGNTMLSEAAGAGASIGASKGPNSSLYSGNGYNAISGPSGSIVYSTNYGSSYGQAEYNSNTNAMAQSSFNN